MVLSSPENAYFKVGGWAAWQRARAGVCMYCEIHTKHENKQVSVIHLQSFRSYLFSSGCAQPSGAAPKAWALAFRLGCTALLEKEHSIRSAVLWVLTNNSSR